MGKTSESLAELGGNQSGYAQEISNRKFETPSNGVIGRPGGGREDEERRTKERETREREDEKKGGKPHHKVRLPYL